MSLERCTATPRLGVILAGGLSRRMGTDKALLELNGTTLLNQTVNTLKDAGCQSIVLSGYSRSGFTGTVISDETTEAGPVAGIISCLKHVIENYPAGTECLFIAVDMPRATSTLLKALIKNSQLSDGAYFEDHPLPFCLRISDATAALVNAPSAIFSGTKSPSIRSFLAPLDITLLQPDAGQLEQLININTPDVWEKIVNSM